jgi:Zn-dependent membrane protease YugP
MFFDFNYLLWVFLPTLVLTGLAQWWIRSSYSRASQIPNMQRVTGAQAARRILDSAGLNHVNIESTAPVQSLKAVGMNATPSLDDHYDPSAKVLRLSPGVYAGTSVAALGVAAHEAGHAVQDAQAYPWMRARTAIVPAANIGTQFGFILVFVGLIFHVTELSWLGVGAFALGTMFALLTLPVELNASSRAMQMLTANGLVDRTEYGEARRVLNAAAFTYIAALAVSVLNLLYYVMLVSGMGRRRD